MSEQKTYFVGWDVGAWKCSAGRNDSCDAIVVLRDKAIVGHYRANLSGTLHDLAELPKEKRPESFINKWFSLACGNKNPPCYSPTDKYVVAIDTPLGWPKDFKTLLDGTLPEEWSYEHDEANLHNTLLYRYTERQKLAGGLSVIVDSIGSQSVKGLVLLETLDAKEKSWGVWASGNVTFLETYPKACLVRPQFVEWIKKLCLEQPLAESFKTLASTKPNTYRDINVIPEDLFDAGICACVAKAFEDSVPRLVSPSDGDPDKYKPEGWIFYPDEPTDGTSQSIADGHKAKTCAEGVVTFHDAIIEFQKYIESKSAGKE
ncbi:DUF429 domain-containing protein [Rubripirellula sp.]|nr:DUF429 domain-containing protein [Rubripirellula sp.]